MRARRIATLTAACATAASATTFAGIQPAAADIWGPQASHGAPYSGADGYWDEGTSNVLGYGYITQGHLVGLWQTFLRNYDQVPACGVDGRWGPTTVAGTANIQSFFGKTPDGVVGAQTWDAASKYLMYYGTSYANTAQEKTYYIGAFSQVTFGGGWYYQNKNDPYKGYWYWDSPYITKWYTSPVNSSSGPDLTFAPWNPAYGQPPC